MPRAFESLPTGFIGDVERDPALILRKFLISKIRAGRAEEPKRVNTPYFSLCFYIFLYKVALSVVSLACPHFSFFFYTSMRRMRGVEYGNVPFSPISPKSHHEHHHNKA